MSQRCVFVNPVPYFSGDHRGGSLTMTSQSGLHWQIDLTPSPVMVVFFFDLPIWWFNYIYIWYISWYSISYIYIYLIIYIYIYNVNSYKIYIIHIYIYTQYICFGFYDVFDVDSLEVIRLSDHSDHVLFITSIDRPNPLVHQVVLLKLWFFSGIQKLVRGPSHI